MKLNMQQAFFGALLGLWMAKVFEPALDNIVLLGFLVVYGGTVVLLLSLATNTEVQGLVRFFLYGVSGIISAGFAAGFKTYVHPIVSRLTNYPRPNCGFSSLSFSSARRSRNLADALFQPSSKGRG